MSLPRRDAEEGSLTTSRIASPTNLNTPGSMGTLPRDDRHNYSITQKDHGQRDSTTMHTPLLVYSRTPRSLIRLQLYILYHIFNVQLHPAAEFLRPYLGSTLCTVRCLGSRIIQVLYKDRVSRDDRFCLVHLRESHVYSKMDSGWKILRAEWFARSTQWITRRELALNDFRENVLKERW